MTTYTFSSIADPLAITATGGTLALGVNDFGQIVGGYYDSTDTLHGFLYSGGTYNTLNAPGATNGTEAYKINNLGQIVGLYTDSNGDEHGFLYSSSTFTYTPLNDGIYGTEAHGINDAGQIVGQYNDSRTRRTASFTTAAPTPQSTIHQPPKVHKHMQSTTRARSSGPTLTAAANTAFFTATALTLRSTVRRAPV